MTPRPSLFTKTTEFEPLQWAVCARGHKLLFDLIPDRTRMTVLDDVKDMCYLPDDLDSRVAYASIAHLALLLEAA